MNGRTPKRATTASWQWKASKHRGTYFSRTRVVLQIRDGAVREVPEEKDGRCF